MKKWLTGLCERYERWRVRQETKMVEELRDMLRADYMGRQGLLVVRREERLNKKGG